MMWFKDDLSWLSMQELPKSLKPYIITLKENATTQYSQTISKTVIDEAKEFSASKKEENCNIQRETAAEQEAIVEQEAVVGHEEDQTTQGNAANFHSETKKQGKRKLISTNDALDELEDEIVEYEKQPISSVIEEKFDMKKEFLGLKKETLNKYRKGHAINIELNISSLM
ncbi:hypothetical protein HPULCUR_010159 [Helicostylum pulchrum]|uniref:Uncharacterized protein n=1 Tax=Helicostylum pulchrum TaxID=562976 RepID=A0ABP9YCH5_9FUNG